MPSPSLGSLHHIRPLRTAIDRARELLNPLGLLLIEDFAFEEADDATIDWFLSVLRSEQGRRSVNPVTGQLVTDLLSSNNAMEVWRLNRGHDVHPFKMINETIAERFVVRETQTVPYLYRYLIPVLAETSEAVSFVNEVFQRETVAGQRGEIVLLGRRIVASLRF